MSFELPRIRVKLENILNSFTDFLKRPSRYLEELEADLRLVNLHLAGQCSLLQSKQATKAELEQFIEELKLFLSAETADKFNESNEISLGKSISNIQGVGPKTVEALASFGISTVKDLLFAVPMRYEHLSTGIVGGKGVLEGKLEGTSVIHTRKGKSMFQAAFSYPGGYFYCIWLHYSNQFPASSLSQGKQHHMYGAITTYNGVPAIFHPEILEPHEVDTVRPVYSSPGKISQKVYQKILKNAVDKYMHLVNEVLPESIRFLHKLPEIKDSINTLHYPVTAINASEITRREHPAFKRLVYEELFYLQIRLFLKKQSYMQNQGIVFNIDKPLLEDIAPLMPFRLTDAQRFVLKEIFNDMRSQSQMNRLLQGDVGSGKTIVAFIAALAAVKNGYQAVILAPTEVLAEQHFRNIEKFIQHTGYHAALLTGSVKAKDKKQIKELIESGDINFVIGTHAIIQEDVVFKRLGFAVIDEQHRFGVLQRKALMSKGFTPDVLLMTATPIPRTLALTCYGDLDLSVIESMPPGRIPSVTKVFRAERLGDAFNFVKTYLNHGDRAYFVYPAIEESDKTNLKSVTKNVEEIKKRFPDKKVGLLHGKLRSDEKHEILRAFQLGDIDILVSTTVVEVGVDVKDATVIMIENADRFGLAQLHQLRGRVGRNDRESYCVLVASEEVSETGFKRLRAMETHTSGFKLAELDLELRGQGDFFGVKQSGMPEFQYADILKDADILQAARTDARHIIDDDPHLEKNKNRLIRNVLMYRWKDEYELFLIG